MLQITLCYMGSDLGNHQIQRNLFNMKKLKLKKYEVIFLTKSNWRNSKVRKLKPFYFLKKKKIEGNAWGTYTKGNN